MTSTRPHAGARIAYLDGIRALALSVVVAVHLVHPYFPHFPGGYVGVDVFFVLSGYIITTILWRRGAPDSAAGAYGSFLRQRVRRLYPALTGLLVVGTILVALFRAPVTTGEALEGAGWAAIQAGPIVQALDLHPMLPFSHTWTLAVEWMFYVLWPIALLIAQRRGVSAWRLACIAGMLAPIMYVLALQTTPEWFYYGPAARSAQLLAGCALALALQHRSAAFPSWVGSAFVAVGVGVILGWTVVGSHHMDGAYRTIGFPAVTVASLMLVSSGVLVARSKGTALLGASPLTFIGRISYSAYLWHLVPMHVLDIDDFSVPAVTVGAMGIVMFAGATLASFYLLERPFLRPQTAKLSGAVKRAQ